MKPACPRLFEVEARRDGRLTGAELDRFEIHVVTCAACAEETRALDALAEDLRSPSAVADGDELHVRRQRTRLLAAFDERLAPALPKRCKLEFGAVAASAAVAAFALLRWQAHGDGGVPPAAAPVVLGAPPATSGLVDAPGVPDAVAIRADKGAKWSRRTAGQLDQIVIESGALSIHVQHAVSHHRLLLVLPDGELEDIGTTFSVSVADGRTRRVTVQDGAIVLRLFGQPPLRLLAGDSWSPSVPDPAPPRSALALHGAKAVSSARPALSVAAPNVAAPNVAVPGGGFGSSGLGGARDPSADFRAAMSAFDEGENARAAEAFAVFVRQHPRDARAEDAAFLRVLALERTGNTSATRQAAQDYVTRFPNGFRRTEAEALSR